MRVTRIGLKGMAVGQRYHRGGGPLVNRLIDSFDPWQDWWLSSRSCLLYTTCIVFFGRGHSHGLQQLGGSVTRLCTC